MLMEKERREKILEIHECLPTRKVILKSGNHTKAERWTSKDFESLVGKPGVVIAVHENVLEAVKVNINDGEDIRFWHFKDLELQIENSDPVIVHFDPAFIDV